MQVRIHDSRRRHTDLRGRQALVWDQVCSMALFFVHKKKYCCVLFEWIFLFKWELPSPLLSHFFEERKGHTPWPSRLRGLQRLIKIQFENISWRAFWDRDPGSDRAVSQLKVDLKFTTKFNSFREFAKEVKVQFIGHKLNFNFSQLMDELFWVATQMKFRENEVPPAEREEELSFSCHDNQIL